MIDIRDRIESEISEIKESCSDLFIVDHKLLNFNIPHRVDFLTTFFDYSDYYISEGVRHVNQKIKMKLTVFDMLNRVELEIDFVGYTYLNVYTNHKTGQFEGESLSGYRLKNWQIVNYNLDLYYEGI